ncbi:nucleoside monophosphate kinase, partial [Thiolapillus sp.]
MRIILLGPPGSGKSVISRKIAEKYGFPVVSVEEVAEELSAMAQQDDELGRLAKESIGSGRVSDDVCNTVLKRVLGKEELGLGFVLVGYPKDAAQAEFIETAMNQMRRPLDLVMMIDIDRDELMERRVGRIDCDACGTHYNLYVNPPMVEGICDLCGSRVSRRPRGYEENIANQLREYDVAVQPVLDYFRQLNKLRLVDANGTEEQLWESVQTVIDSTEPAPVLEAPEEKTEKKEAAARPASQKTAGTKRAVTKKAVARKAQEKSQASKKTTTKKKPAAKKKAAPKAAEKSSAKAKVAQAPKKAAKKKVEKKAAVKKAASKKKVA